MKEVYCAFSRGGLGSKSDILQVTVDSQWNQDWTGFICCSLCNYSKSQSLLRHKEYQFWKHLSRSNRFNFRKLFEYQKNNLDISKQVNIFGTHQGGKTMVNLKKNLFLEENKFPLPTNSMVARFFSPLHIRNGWNILTLKSKGIKIMGH